MDNSDATWKDLAIEIRKAISVLLMNWSFSVMPDNKFKDLLAEFLIKNLKELD